MARDSRRAAAARRLFCSAAAIRNIRVFSTKSSAPACNVATASSSDISPDSTMTGMSESTLFATLMEANESKRGRL